MIEIKPSRCLNCGYKNIMSTNFKFVENKKRKIKYLKGEINEYRKRIKNFYY